MVRIYSSGCQPSSAMHSGNVEEGVSSKLYLWIDGLKEKVLRMSQVLIGQCIKRLRQERGWSQGQLALKIHAHQRQISKYERNVSLPSLEVLLRLATVFNVSTDELLFDSRGKSSAKNIADKELLQKIIEIDEFSSHERVLIKEILDAFIIKNRFQRVAASSEQQNQHTGQ